MDGAPQKAASPVKSNPLQFINEVAKYFMDFLETDFHRRQTPKRAIRFRNPDNLLVAMGFSSSTCFPRFASRRLRFPSRLFAGPPADCPRASDPDHGIIRNQGLFTRLNTEGYLGRVIRIPVSEGARGEGI
jgi:hypothetical protein